MTSSPCPRPGRGSATRGLESVTHRRPLVIGPYPVADELLAFGFRWFRLDDVVGLDDWMDHPDASLVENNLDVARANFSLGDLPVRIGEVLARCDDLPGDCAGRCVRARRRPGATMTGMPSASTPGSTRSGGVRARSTRRLTADARRRQLFDVAPRSLPSTAIGHHHGRHRRGGRRDQTPRVPAFRVEAGPLPRAARRLLPLLIDRIVQATAAAEGPRQQVEMGFAGYFELMVDNEDAFRLLYGRDAPDDVELGAALRRVEETIAQAIDPLIDAGLDPEHRLLLAHAVVGMAEGASRHWLDAHRARRTSGTGGTPRTRPTGPPRHRAWPPSWPTSPGPACGKSTGSDASPTPHRRPPDARSAGAASGPGITRGGRIRPGRCRPRPVGWRTSPRRRRPHR